MTRRILPLFLCLFTCLLMGCSIYRVSMSKPGMHGYSFEASHFVDLEFHDSTREQRVAAWILLLDEINADDPEVIQIASTAADGRISMRVDLGWPVTIWHVDFHSAWQIASSDSSGFRTMRLSNWSAHASQKSKISPTSASSARNKALLLIRAKIHSALLPGKPLHGRISGSDLNISRPFFPEY